MGGLASSCRRSVFSSSCSSSSPSSTSSLASSSSSLSEAPAQNPIQSPKIINTHKQPTKPADVHSAYLAADPHDFRQRFHRIIVLNQDAKQGQNLSESDRAFLRHTLGMLYASAEQACARQHVQSMRVAEAEQRARRQHQLIAKKRERFTKKYLEKTSKKQTSKQHQSASYSAPLASSRPDTSCNVCFETFADSAQAAAAQKQAQRERLQRKSAREKKETKHNSFDFMDDDVGSVDDNASVTSRVDVSWCSLPFVGVEPSPPASPRRGALKQHSQNQPPALVKRSKMKLCGHSAICTDCLMQHISSQISSTFVLPFIRCPHPSCTAIIHHQDLCATYQLNSTLVSAPLSADGSVTLELLSTSSLCQLAYEIMLRVVKRNKQLWLPCGTFPLSSATNLNSSTTIKAKHGESCPFGFIINPTQAYNATCEHCGVEQKVELSADASSAQVLDDSMSAMIAAGTLRACPSCDSYQMKDYGMCNVLQCHSCSVWWNWRTRAYGSSQSELKEQARMSGSLWEQGELSYQMNLQRNDLEAFKRLLANNGIQYDPKYVRGGF